MIAKLAQAATCLAFLALVAPAASAQASTRAPNIDQTKYDETIRLYQDATKYYQAGNVQLAEQTLDKVLDKEGKFAGAYFLMGMVQIQKQDFNKARTAFRNAVKYDGKMASARGYLGALEAGLGNPKGAQEQREALVKLKECTGKGCPKAEDVDLEIQRIDENLAAAAAPKQN